MAWGPRAHCSRDYLLFRSYLNHVEKKGPHIFSSKPSTAKQAYGYGIEMDGIEALLNTSLYSSDDLGEGVCQSFSLTDQLEMGLRRPGRFVHSGGAGGFGAGRV